ncbi:unnamed protein product [Brassica rapa subsp. trilocularis]
MTIESSRSTDKSLSSPSSTNNVSNVDLKRSELKTISRRRILTSPFPSIQRSHKF